MKYKKVFSGLVAFGVMLLVAGTSSGDDPDIRHIPPNVMLLVDTSGSMEFLRETHQVPDCKGDPELDDETLRTRWMMVTDALLGPISNETFQCSRIYPDKSYTYFDTAIDELVTMSIPEDHIMPHYIAEGTRDVTYGILERYREFVRFGLSTMDSFESIEMDEDGMWSYGPVPEDRNVGIKKEEESSGGSQEDIIPGAMVSWGPDTQRLDMTNWMVRKELVQAIPYCGSPIAAALDDVEYFFVSDDDNKPPTENGFDRYYECRDRFVILVTDGQPNTPNPAYPDNWGYDKPPEQAADLWEMSPKVPLYIVWMPQCPKDEDPVSDYTSGKEEMDKIAHAGCPPTDPLCPEGVYPVESMREIMEALEAILYRVMSNAVSRTVAMTTNLVGPHATAGVVQYQFNTSFIPNQDAPWQGILERSSYSCNAADEIELKPGERLDYHEKLDIRNGVRKIYTAIDSLTKAPDSDPDLFDVTNIDLTPAVLGDDTRDAAWVADVVDFMHGRNGSARDYSVTPNGHRLGDPFHASAALAGPPVSDLPFVSYYEYQADEADRIPVIFLATNQGMVHAFRVQDTGSEDTKGEELWAYIPGSLLPKVANQMPTAHIWGADSTPVVEDIRLFKDNDFDSNDEEWMSILIGGLRQGGYGYYALDVSEPETPKFLWEITPQKEVDLDEDGENDFINLKETYATPLLGTVFTNHPTMGSGPLGEIAVAIFPGGFNPASRNASTDLYIVTADEGVLIKRLEPEFPDDLGCTNPPDCAAKPECCAQMITSPVGFAAMAGYLTTRVFVGDDRGRLWRADLSSKDSEDWTLNLFYPILEGQDDAPYTVAGPMESPPGVALDEHGHLTVVFGTGDIDDLTAMEQNYIFSVNEVIEYNSATSSYIGKAEPNWSVQLEEGEKMIGQPVIFNKTAYFTTFVPYSNEEDLCSFGRGKIWGVHYQSKDPDDDGDESDFARLDVDGDPDGEGDVREYLEYYNTIISGLTVVQRPSCLNIDPMTGLSLGQESMERYDIVAQCSGSGGAHEGGRQTKTITLGVPAPTFRNLADSWGAMLD